MSITTPTAETIDAAAGDHVWAERYDRAVADVFSVQDDVTRTIVATVVGRVKVDGIERARRKTTENMTAYDYYLRGLDFYQRRRHSPDNIAQALIMFEKAIEFDPDLATAYAWYACAASGSWFHSRDDHDLDTSLDYARKALWLDGNDCEAHYIAAIILIQQRDFDRAWRHIKTASDLNSNDAAVKAGGLAREGAAIIGQRRLGCPYTVDHHAHGRRSSGLRDAS